MRHRLYAALGLVLGACVPARSRVAPPPTLNATACGRNSAPIAYVIDDKPATCDAVMSLPRSRIGSVEVLKGDVAVSLYGPSAATGVVVIRTTQQR